MGIGTPDDAGVYRVRPDLAIVQTIDFFTPVVDDPYQFGQVAAANALSDIYAMGAIPLTALNLVAFPTCTLGIDILKEILRGGADKVREAGAVLLGGHSVEDREPKYGLAVTGLVHPDRLISKQGAQPGDLLILTKPLGTGVLVTALKGGLLSSVEERALGEQMAALNDIAARAMSMVGVHACTDITGFGLLGHLHELAEASGVDMEIDVAAVPLMHRSKELASQGLVPAGTYRNREFLAPFVSVAGEVPDVLMDLLYDPQTSGGLLMAVPESQKDQLFDALRRGGLPHTPLIGRVQGSGSGKIQLRGF
jgi:selenide,water dikinase